MRNEFDGHTLSNVKATISAFVTDAAYMNPDPALRTRLYWSLDIDADVVGLAGEYEGKLLSEPMRFYHDIISFSDDLRSWKMLLGQKIEWEDRYYAGIDGAYPSFYLQTHQAIEAGKINFVECEGNQFRVIWDGVTKDGDFSIDVWAIFEGVEIFRNVAKEETATDVLARHLSADEYYEEPPSHPEQSYARFRPKLEAPI